MEAEQCLLATNLISLGECLHQFVFRLSEVLEWKAIVDNMVLGDPDSDADSRRTIMMRIFAERLLSTLDFNDSMHLDPVIVRTIAFMKSFFVVNSPIRRCQYFTSPFSRTDHKVVQAAPLGYKCSISLL
jgi:hypothetical protein